MQMLTTQVHHSSVHHSSVHHLSYLLTAKSQFAKVRLKRKTDFTVHLRCRLVE